MATKTMIDCPTAPLQNKLQLAAGRWDRCLPVRVGSLRPPQQPAVRPYGDGAFTAKSRFTHMHFTQCVSSSGSAEDHSSLYTINGRAARVCAITHGKCTIERVVCASWHRDLLIQLTETHHSRQMLVIHSKYSKSTRVKELKQPSNHKLPSNNHTLPSWINRCSK